MRVTQRLLLPVFACLLPAAAMCQAKQFAPDFHRSPDLFYGFLSSLDSITVGDVDGDGDLDFVTTKFNAWFQATSVLLFRQQSGGWQQTVLASMPAPVFFAVDVSLVDLDGDADLDVVMVVNGNASITDTRLDYLQNDGSGAFTIAGSTQLSGAVSATVVAQDVDGDSDRDLVIASVDAGGQEQPLALYLHDGLLGFQEVVGAFPATVASAPDLVDLDSDGDYDVVAVHATAGVLAFTNTGGTFSGGLVSATSALHVLGADLDGDGDGDLIVQQSDGALVLLENTATGFQSQVVAAGGVAAGQRPVLADLDGDLDIDVVVNADNQLRVFRNDDLASLVAEDIAGSQLFAVGDANQDGILDVLFLAEGGGIATALGNPTGMVIDPVLLRGKFVASGSRGYTEDTADFGNDNHVDILQADFYRVLLRRNHGVGEWSTVEFEVPFLRPKTRAADVDGDGDEDIVVVNNDGPGGLQVFENVGGFVFVALPLQVIPPADIVGKGHFNNDLRTDLLIRTSAGLQLLRSTGSGVFASPALLPSGGGDWYDPGVWDFDEDGDLDVLISAPTGSCSQLLANDGSGNFTVANPCVVSLFAVGIKLVDIDGDGDPDLFKWGYGSGQMFIYENGVYTPGQAIQGVFASALLQPRFADWDGDGDIDLMQNGGPAQLWINSGDGTLVDETNTRIGWSEFSSAGAADLDGDGDVDVLGVFGMSGAQKVNHHRSATSLVVPRPGGQMQVRYAHQPGYSSGNAVCLPILSLAPRNGALSVPGIAGMLQIDLTASVLLPFLSLPAPGGTADSSFSIPLQPGLIGFDLYAQGLIVAESIAFTPAIHERVL